MCKKSIYKCIKFDIFYVDVACSINYELKCLVECNSRIESMNDINKLWHKYNRDTYVIGCTCVGDTYVTVKYKTIK